jgi:TPR repeat protein
MHHRGALKQIPEATTIFAAPSTIKHEQAQTGTGTTTTTSTSGTPAKAGKKTKKEKKSKKRAHPNQEEDDNVSSETVLASQWWEHAVSGGHFDASYDLAQLLEANPGVMPQLLQLRRADSNTTAQDTAGNEKEVKISSTVGGEVEAPPSEAITATAAVEQEVLRLYGVAAAGGVAEAMHALGIAYHQVQAQWCSIGSILLNACLCV